MATAERRQVDAKETESSSSSTGGSASSSSSTTSSSSSNASSEAGTPTTPRAEAPGAREVVTEGSYLTILPMNCVANIVKPEVVAAARCYERFEHSQRDADEEEAEEEERERGPIKVSSEARQRFLDSATEFVMFITQEASDMCAAERRRVMNSNDILTAVETLGFGQQYEAVARRALMRLGEAQQQAQGDSAEAQRQPDATTTTSTSTTSSSSKPKARHPRTHAHD